ncbi:hypothetical protein TrRE_jg10989 [Triparma retinervis]|uniref:Uncharacterized protein n=1 Tax=Triparma retinervis TaxID=2557542 RepID=A0A9W7EC52_9STRA|nr:hypothetical protein TrRE_jg10989 [Triparma retinervis]
MMLKIICLCFPQTGRIHKERQDHHDLELRASSTTESSTRWSKRHSILCTPGHKHRPARRTPKLQKDGPASPSVNLSHLSARTLPLLETPLDASLLLPLYFPGVSLPRLVALRCLHSLSHQSDELTHDILTLLDPSKQDQNSTMVKQILKIIIWCAAAREILLLLGLTELSKSLGAGFGYGGLMIGWGLKEVVQEKVISYEGWEKRRCQLNVAIDADTEGDKVGELKRAVGEYVAKLEEVKPSDPCCYCTGFTGGGLEVEVVYYICNYQDDIAKFKKVNDGVTMALKHNIDRLQIKVYKPFSV